MRSRPRLLLVAAAGVATVLAIGAVSAGAATDSPGAALGASSRAAAARHPHPPTSHPPTSHPPTSRPATPAPGAWVSVDPAQQAKDTTAFFARKPAPVSAGNPRTAPEFHAQCAVFHHASDDPIVFPGRAGASHNHTFFGNASTNADSTLQSLDTGASTCAPAQDHSAYWIPTLYSHAKVVDPKEVTIYYGTNLKDYAKIQPFPRGLRMIVGNPMQQTGTDNSHFFCAGGAGEQGRTADGLFPVCGVGANLVRYIVFPECWDGVHLDSPDHKAHMANGIGGGVCPADHPVPLPTLVYVLSYPDALGHDPAAITLSSGTIHSLHADFFNAWQPAALAQRVRDCLNQHVKCDAEGRM
jgi:Domain of unknown function (DUF1996)